MGISPTILGDMIWMNLIMNHDLTSFPGILERCCMYRGIIPTAGRKKHLQVGEVLFSQNGGYSLVNVYITMENHHV